MHVTWTLRSRVCFSAAVGERHEESLELCYGPRVCREVCRMLAELGARQAKA